MWIKDSVGEILAPFSKIWDGAKNWGSHPVAEYRPQALGQSLAQGLGANVLTENIMQSQQTPAGAQGFGQIQVDFSNLPRGARVSQSKNNTLPIDLGMGFAMVTP
jgi:hypothetical protein